MRLLTLIALVSALVPAASGQVAQRIADLRLATAVRLALVDNDRTRPLDIEVAAQQGAVTVAGDVPASERPSVVSVARGVAGVRTVSGLGAGDTPSGPVVIVSDRPPLRSEPDAPSRAGGPLVHTVERGDTLFGLARLYDTTVPAILSQQHDLDRHPNRAAPACPVGDPSSRTEAISRERDQTERAPERRRRVRCPRTNGTG